MTDKEEVVAALQAVVDDLALRASGGGSNANEASAWAPGVLVPLCQRLRQMEAWPAADSACSASAVVVPCASTSLALARTRYVVVDASCAAAKETAATATSSPLRCPVPCLAGLPC